MQVVRSETVQGDNASMNSISTSVSFDKNVDYFQLVYIAEIVVGESVVVIKKLLQMKVSHLLHTSHLVIRYRSLFPLQSTRRCNDLNL